MAKKVTTGNSHPSDLPSITPQQQQRLDQFRRNQQRRNELADQIARGEENLLASNDERTRRVLDQRLTALRDELQFLDDVLSRGHGEPFEEFSQRMNNDGIHIDRQLICEREDGVQCTLAPGIVLFSNGAWSNGRDEHVEPPKSPIKLLPLQIAYMSQVLARAEANADRIKKYIRLQSTYHGMGAGPLPNDSAYEDLKRLKVQITDLTTKLEAAQTQLKALRGPSAQEVWEDQCARNQQAHESAIQRLLQLQM